MQREPERKPKSNHCWQVKRVEERVFMIKHLNRFVAEMNKVYIYICIYIEKEEKDREEGKYHSLGRHH